MLSGGTIISYDGPRSRRKKMRANRLAVSLSGTGMVALVLLAAACDSTQSAQNASTKHTQSSAPAMHAAATTTDYNPNIDPANFVKKIDNPVFPLKPGTKYELQSKTSDGVGHETLTVTHDTQKKNSVKAKFATIAIRSQPTTNDPEIRILDDAPLPFGDHHTYGAKC